jgi:hypothetical protein
VTPAALAREVPRLYHVTAPGVAAEVRAHGLLCSASLVRASTLSSRQQAALLQTRRDAEVPLTLSDGRTVHLNDQLPLSVKALTGCLDDGWQPQDWIAHLNAHVFFWPSEERLASLLAARMNRDREREVLVFDSASLVSAHAERVHLSPINSGATMRKAARRGRATFTPISACSFDEWRRLRARSAPDDVAEVLVRGDVPDARSHLVEVRRYRGGARC